MQIVIISGQSGAGKSHAANILEDMGYYCVDNMPVELLTKFAEFCISASGKYERVALVSDIRAGESFSKLFAELNTLGTLGCETKIIFLEAETETIVRRYKETRRPHPLMTEGDSIEQVVLRERDKLMPLRLRADLVLDTTGKSGNRVKDELADFLGGAAMGGAMLVSIVSFGFKYGIPTEADLIFDVRFLPNPFYVEGLRDQTGLDKEVRDYVFSYEVTGTFLEKLVPMIEFLLPHYVEEGKSILTIGIGCTGGRHRSTAIASHLAGELEKLGYSPTLSHRDVAKG